jgi:hypothetical protein
MSEKRAQPRNLCSDIVELYWDDHLGWPHRAMGILEDINRTGACVQTDAKIPVDTPLAVRLEHTGFPGQVCYCTLVGGSYFLGLKFAKGHEWSESDPQPKYLLRWPVHLVPAVTSPSVG